MLRVIQQAAAAAAKSYYSQADYYAEGAEAQGVWGGRGAALLGLAGPVRERDFHALCDNLDPRSGDRLTARTRADRTVLYDFNFHAPKSVTLAYELTGDDRIRAAFERAVETTMTDIEAEAKARVRKGGRDAERTTGNLAWATFVHRTARPSKEDGRPDPHLHAHATVFNATFDRSEGQWKAGQFRDLKRDAPYWQATFHARLARSLAELGYGVTRSKAGWELTGVTPALVRKFSRRTAEIEKLAAALGVTDPDAKGKLGATSRRRKAAATISDLTTYWQGRLTADETAALRSLLRQPRSADSHAEVSADAAMAHAVSHSFERESVVPEKHLLAEALRYGVGGVTVEGVRAAATRHGVFSAALDGRTVVTTKDVLAEERRLLAIARDGRGTRPALNPDPAAGEPYLSDDQRRAMRHVLDSPDRVILVRGIAGTGKTTMSLAAVAAVRATGRPVVVLAPTAKASRETLRVAGFPDAETVAAFLASKDRQAQVKGGVIWVDEAGQLGIKDMAALFDRATELDARVVLVGDTQQHGSVPRGPALKLLETHAGLPRAELSDIRRQAGDYKAAVEQLAAGQTEAGFDALDQLGWVREADDNTRPGLIAADYVAARKAKESVLIVSPTHYEGRAITAAVRGLLKEEGTLGEEREFARLVPLHRTEAERADPVAYTPGEVVQFVRQTGQHRAGTRVTVADPKALPLDKADRFAVFETDTISLAAGDLIRLTSNGKTKDGKHGVSNGVTYTVAGFTPAGDVRLAENGWVLDKGFAHWTHGYVATSVASQGMSVKRVLVGQGAASFGATGREQFYVSLSRGQAGATVYTDDKAALREAVGRADRRVTATDLVSGQTALTRPPTGRLQRTVAFLARQANLARARVLWSGEPTRTADRELVAAR